MKVFYTQVERILNTLPIGTYLGRRIEVSLSDSSECSFIDFINQAIVVSYDQVANTVSKIEDPKFVETAIRTCLYHEVSHAILTPKYLLDILYTEEQKRLINITEDERIESMLRHYYTGVDFRRTVELMNGWDEEVAKTRPRDAMDAFYRVMRFHHGKREWLEEADRIIETYSRFVMPGYCAWDYKNDVVNLYRTIARDFPDTPDDEMNQTSMPTNSQSGEEGESQDGETNIQQDGEGKNSSAARGMKEAIEDAFYGFEAENSMYAELMPIISSFNKKNAGGSAIAAHSGVLNPRLVGRPDYRIFDRKSSERGANKFCSVHLNLFLDESGSYCSNVPKTNQLIAALTQVEKLDKNFTFDICYCGMGERIVDNKFKRTMKAQGGNNLDEKIFDIYRRLQKPNTYNYNIVLFDGDAFTDSPCGLDYRKHFAAFNHSNCTIISDYDNEYAINRYATGARKIFTRDYVNELQKNVISALRFAFR